MSSDPHDNRSNPKDPPASSLFTEPLTPECTSRQQQSSAGLQTDLPIGGAVSGELLMALSALKNLSNGQRTTNSPSGGCQPASSFAKNPLMAEDPKILVAEGISNNTSSLRELSDNICSNQHWHVHKDF
jgi:hypothetical protein